MNNSAKVRRGGTSTGANQGKGATAEAAVFGRFIFGILSGTALVVCGMVVAAALFPLTPPGQTAIAAEPVGPATEAVEPVVPETTAEVTAEAPVAATIPEEPDATAKSEAADPAEASVAEALPVAEPDPAPEPPPVALTEPPAEEAAPQSEALAETPEDTTPTPVTEPAPEAEGDIVAAGTEAEAGAATPEPTAEGEPAVAEAAAPVTEAEVEVEVETAMVSEEPPAPEVAPAIVAETAPAEAPAAAPAETPATPNFETQEETQPEIVAEDLNESPVETPPGTSPETLPELATVPEIEEIPLLDALPEIEPLPEPEVAADVAVVPEPELAPLPELGRSDDGIIIGRLPRIGDAPVDATPAAGAPAAATPLTQFAVPFQNPDKKPVFAIVLIDPGTPDLDRAGLAALPFPVSFALDPLDPATPDRVAVYLAGGKEVVMLATGIAEGSQASDIEVAFQSMAQGLPEAVAVMDIDGSLFQNNRPVASLVVPVVEAQGRGLLTWDVGLNAADQVARRDDVPAAVVFRDLAASGEDGAAIQRILGRAIFKAGQDGRVAVAATASPGLVATLLEWTVEGKAASVALAPVSAVLTVE